MPTIHEAIPSKVFKLKSSCGKFTFHITFSNVKRNDYKGNLVLILNLQKNKKTKYIKW